MGLIPNPVNDTLRRVDGTITTVDELLVRVDDTLTVCGGG